MNTLGKDRGHHTANRVYDDLRAVFSWGIKYGYHTGENPCTGITKFKTRSRERFIRPDEFEKFLEGLKTEKNIPFRDYIYLSLFTGSRQGSVHEIGSNQLRLGALAHSNHQEQRITDGAANRFSQCRCLKIDMNTESQISGCSSVTALAVTWSSPKPRGANFWSELNCYLGKEQVTPQENRSQPSNI